MLSFIQHTHSKDGKFIPCDTRDTCEQVINHFVTTYLTAMVCNPGPDFIMESMMPIVMECITPEQMVQIGRRIAYNVLTGGRVAPHILLKNLPSCQNPHTCINPGCLDTSDFHTKKATARMN